MLGRRGLLHCTKQLPANARSADVLIFIGYFRSSGTTRAANPPAKTRRSVTSDGDKTAPLTFAAGMVGAFDLEPTVTILQQDFWGFGSGIGPNEAPETHPRQVAEGIN
jgi:hypothetical protein